MKTFLKFLAGYSIAIWLGFGITCLILLSGCAQASEPPAQVRAVIGEAENQGYEGMLAVADAIRHRGTLHGVYGLHARRVRLHLYSQQTLELANRAWISSRTLDVTKGATGWGSASDLRVFETKSWWPSMVITAHIGDHWFYKEAI